MNKNNNDCFDAFKIQLLFFLGAWFLFCFTTNFSDFLVNMNLLPDIAFASHNYQAVVAVTSIYHTPQVVVNILFVGDIVLLALSSGLFFMGAISFWQTRQLGRLIKFAFLISCSLWSLLLLCDEIFIAYKMGVHHCCLFVLELVIMLIVYSPRLSSLGRQP